MKMAPEVKSDFTFELSDFDYPGNHVHIASNSHFGDFRGHVSLKMASMASEFKYDLRFEISNLNYPGIHMHIASNSHFGDL